MTTSATRRSDAERNLERIVDAAIETLFEKPEAGMGEIAARAGVGRATLYRHYPSRSALLEAIHDRAVEEAERALLATEPENGPAGEALVRLVVALAGVIKRYRVLSLNKHELAQDREDERIRSHVIAVIERGQREGEFTREMPAETIAQMLKGMLMATCSGGEATGVGEFVARVLVRGVDPEPQV